MRRANPNRPVPPTHNVKGRNVPSHAPQTPQPPERSRGGQKKRSPPQVRSEPLPPTKGYTVPRNQPQQDPRDAAAVRCYSVAEAAEILGLGETRLKELLRTGELRSFKVGSRRLVSARAINEYVERMEALEADYLDATTGPWPGAQHPGRAPQPRTGPR